MNKSGGIPSPRDGSEKPASRAAIINARVSHVMYRIDYATRMFHNAHDNWRSEEVYSGVSYLSWIEEAVRDAVSASIDDERRVRL